MLQPWGQQPEAGCWGKHFPALLGKFNPLFWQLADSFSCSHGFTSAEPSTASQAPAPGQRPHQRGRARSAGAARRLASARGLETARFRASPLRQSCGTEPRPRSSGSAAWLDLAHLRQEEEEDSKAVVVLAGHRDSSPPSQPHRVQLILTVGQREGRIWPLIRAIAKLTALEWASLKGPP